VSGTEYHKIWGPYKRHVDGPDRGKFIIGDWARPEFDVLSDAPWTCTEKINGTNCRIIWDGHKVRFGGRTDEAALRIKAVEWLGAQFPAELLEQQFHADPAVLYGELCGSDTGVNGSGNYGRECRFILFDVNVCGWWLQPVTLGNVAVQMGLELAPVMLIDNIGAAMAMVRGGLRSGYGDFEAEGLVGKPPCGLIGRGGDRLLVKVKGKDFR
jgi:hypothetical protein